MVVVIVDEIFAAQHEFEPRDSMMRVHPTDKFIVTDTLQLHYLEWGNKRAQTMVLLHGIGDNAHIWDHFARNAADHLRIIALDQRGHGLSD